MIRRLLPLAPFAALAACGPTGVTPPPALSSAPSQANLPVMGQDAAGLVRLFGDPDADVREGTARKLQFESAICVLDAYLYPKGSGDPRVTWVDARQRDGSPIDRASCIAALSRREGGK
ncbi:hypothetical protein SAMN05216382_1271 [Sphingomonas palmae]|uniref:Lipoprotein n=1 Tax=Sphingomonas palmae TaxID=1855283 RepID=A0A1H7LMV3_9SPHN|nr:hypothetical protein [Sphingomonas palmae]SEL00058.1 hypothetical protein SAMN05216382_1271 [Sphingomonas palmae]